VPVLPKCSLSFSFLHACLLSSCIKCFQPFFI
jgi:hypothetical protein